jgi:tripartite-type tricarboxylate transporter receptor subunit TctC
MSWNIYLAVRANLPVNSVAELVALARSRPEGLTYGSPGVGSGNHLLGELLKKKSGANLHHVPYRGGAGLSVDLLAGRIDMVFGSYREMHEFVRDGNVKLLAIAADARGTWKPELPTMGEAGFPGISMAPWFGVVVASGTPESTIAQLNAEFRKAAEDPDLRKRLAAQGIDAKVGAPDEFGRLIASEGAKWREVVKEAGLSTE